MSNPYSFKQTDFNSSTGKGIEAILKQVVIYGSEGIKAIAQLIKHLIMTFIGK